MGAQVLPTQRTGREGGGYQVWLRCQTPGRNAKLAYVVDESEAEGRRVAIETRAEGGYALLPGSLHPSGRRYEATQGDFAKIPSVPQSIADLMLEVARSLDEAPLSQREMDAKEKAAGDCPKYQGNGQGSVIDTFNSRYTIEDALVKHGYIRCGTRWKRPGGKTASVTVKDGRSFHHSANDPLSNGYWQRPFDLVCKLDHGGVCSAAVKAAADLMGLKLECKTTNKPALTFKLVKAGTVVKALDRGNFGPVVEDRGESCVVHFDGEQGQADVELSKTLLALQDGTPLAESTDIQIPPPCTLRELVSSHPILRPAVIDGLLRQGETMNLVAAPKAKKSWLVNSLAFSVTAGRDWLEKFRCSPGRVLILDAELHPEVIAHRLPIVAEALGMEQGYDEWIDIEALRGMGVDLFNMAPFIRSIEPGRYSLVILDAWYRFLPPGISENDNAAVMSLYNRIDAYASHLGAAWVNVHHASKGDQSGKSATDVGSGAGSQSRAADSHLVIRPHQEEHVAVVEAVVRSWPPVETFCIRWDYPVWRLEVDGDPRKLRAATKAGRGTLRKIGARLSTSC